MTRYDFSGLPLNDRIARARLGDAIDWANSTDANMGDSYTFCLDWLEISKDSRLAQYAVRRLERRFETLLEREGVC